MLTFVLIFFTELLLAPAAFYLDDPFPSECTDEFVFKADIISLTTALR